MLFFRNSRQRPAVPCSALTMYRPGSAAGMSAQGGGAIVVQACCFQVHARLTDGVELAVLRVLEVRGGRDAIVTGKVCADYGEGAGSAGGIERNSVVEKGGGCRSCGFETGGVLAQGVGILSDGRRGAR